MDISRLCLKLKTKNLKQSSHVSTLGTCNLKGIVDSTPGDSRVLSTSDQFSTKTNGKWYKEVQQKQSDFVRKWFNNMVHVYYTLTSTLYELSLIKPCFTCNPMSVSKPGTAFNSLEFTNVYFQSNFGFPH